MKKQLTILFALVAMTGWAQTAKKSAPESFKGTAVKDSASIYHTLPLPLPSGFVGLPSFTISGNRNPSVGIIR